VERRPRVGACRPRRRAALGHGRPGIGEDVLGARLGSASIHRVGCSSLTVVDQTIHLCERNGRRSGNPHQRLAPCGVAGLTVTKVRRTRPARHADPAGVADRPTAVRSHRHAAPSGPTTKRRQVVVGLPAAAVLVAAILTLAVAMQQGQTHHSDTPTIPLRTGTAEEGFGPDRQTGGATGTAPAPTPAVEGGAASKPRSPDKPDGRPSHPVKPTHSPHPGRSPSG
jgi:hypothetical protein